MRKLLWVGDAVCSTGFAKSTHYILETLRKDWNVTVLGIGYPGEPHPFAYPIYPAATGGDAFGVNRIAGLVKSLQIDCVVLQNDVWNFQPYIDEVRKVNKTCPIIGFVAIDGKNCQGKQLNDLTLAIFWTKFAENEARIGGFTGESAVIPLGVDLSIYQPLGKIDARAMFKFGGKAKPENNSFIVLNVNRNQYRKRLDLTVEYFCEWIKRCNIHDAFLMIHACPTGEGEFDVEQLMEYYGCRNRLLYVKPHMGLGVSELQLALEYNIADAMMSTTQGEGFGLTTFEGMACGIPQIVPDWSALGELCKGAAYLVPCTSHAVTSNGINVIGGIADKELFITALDDLYRNSSLRETYKDKCLQRANEDRFRWQNVGLAFSHQLNGCYCQI